MLFRRVLIGIESLKSTSMIVRSAAAGILAVLLMLSNLISAGAVELSTGDASTDILSSADPSAGDLSVGDSSPECSVDISIEATQASVSAVTGLAASLAESAPFGSTSGGFSWDTEGKSRSWTYYNGIMMDAFLMLDSGYTGRVEQFYSANIGTRKITRKINNAYRDCGYVDNTGASDNYYRPDELDSMPPVRALFDLIRSGSANSSKYISMIEYVYTLMQESSWVISNTGGNYIHKRNNSNWSMYQIALDGLYMAQPFFMELAKAKDEGLLDTGSTSGNINADTIYNEVCSRMIWIGNNLYDSGAKLYNHGYNPANGLGNGHFWSRAIGWYAAALADVISMLPDSYSSQKAALIAIEQQLFDGMIDYRDADTGMWYNVTNRDTTIGDNRLESSGTAVMAYAMMKLYVEDYVDHVYGEAGLKAFNGTVSNKLIGGQLVDVYRSAGVETSDAGYLKNPYTVNEAKGVGPLIMASCYANAAAEKYLANMTVSEADFVLPSNVEIIEQDAFKEAAMEVVVIPSGCRMIGANAFANCRRLTQIRIPDTVETIEDSAFDGCGTVFVFGTSGSVAEEYCEDHTGCIFVSEKKGSFQ